MKKEDKEKDETEEPIVTEITSGNEIVEEEDFEESDDNENEECVCIAPWKSYHRIQLFTLRMSIFFNTIVG